MLELGMRVTINSDDPAYFGGYIEENFLLVEINLKLGPEGSTALSKNAIEASWLPRTQGWIPRSSGCASRCLRVIRGRPRSGRKTVWPLDIHRRGSEVVLTARKPEPLQKVADEVRREHAVEVRTLPLDLTAADMLSRDRDVTNDVAVGCSSTMRALTA
jgi:hypothetical protein